MSVHHVDTLISHDRPYCIISQHKIGLACSKTDLRERVDILLIDGSYRGNITGLIDAHNPHLVIVGANVDSSNAAAIETHCRLKNIKTHPSPKSIVDKRRKLVIRVDEIEFVKIFEVNTYRTACYLFV